MFQRSNKQRKSLLVGKKQWTHERVDKNSDNAINKAYVKYKQCKLNEKSKKLGKAPSQQYSVCIQAEFLVWLKSGM